MINSDNPEQEEAFAEASTNMLSGASLEATLAGQHSHEPELEAMLRTINSVRSVSHPSLDSAALERIRGRALAASRNRVASAHPTEYGSPLPRRTTIFGGIKPWLARLVPGGTPSRGLVIATFVVLILGTVGWLALAPRPHAPGQPVESYSGIIMKISGGNWLVGDDTRVVIDDATEIHGVPAVGAHMTCIAVRLPGPDRFRALEVWVQPAPGGPTGVPTARDGAYLSKP